MLLHLVPQNLLPVYSLPHLMRGFCADSCQIRSEFLGEALAQRLFRDKSRRGLLCQTLFQALYSLLAESLQVRQLIHFCLLRGLLLSQQGHLGPEFHGEFIQARREPRERLLLELALVPEHFLTIHALSHLVHQIGSVLLQLCRGLLPQLLGETLLQLRSGIDLAIEALLQELRLGLRKGPHVLQNLLEHVESGDHGYLLLRGCVHLLL
mmetsp:Transcript_21174/g.46692  ORF Transcript_21174/g.46692 Transcript_21174/m.46692 type:complete len:209 (-) Transcript_21174:731-1357(-)